MDKGIPPEERLLRLIRGRKDSEQKPAIAAPFKKKTNADLAIFHPINKLVKNIITPFLNLKYLNILLVLLLIILSFNSVSQLFIFSQERIKGILLSAKEKEIQDIKEIQISQPKDYGYYNKQFAKRDIFVAPSIEKQADVSPLGSQQAIKNFKLVGIVLDKKPEAILENNVTKETYFLNKGDKLDSIQIKEILESKVILLYGGDEIELEL
ncbi:MAG: hypothetical protein FJZ11_02170 [Candidatus Omnitrophica bacterium]|nr:hypothetical protein [Candidatus Omnitrophota bacterium]